MNSLFSSISYYQTYLTSDELLLFLIEKYSFRWLNTSDTRVPSLLLWQLLSWLFFLGNLPRIFYFYGFLFFRSRPVCGYFIFLVRSMDFLPPGLRIFYFSGLILIFRSADILFCRSANILFFSPGLRTHIMFRWSMILNFACLWILYFTGLVWILCFAGLWILYFADRWMSYFADLWILYFPALWILYLDGLWILFLLVYGYYMLLVYG